jgi:amidase
MAAQHPQGSLGNNVDLLTIDAKALQALLSAGEVTSLGLVRQYVAQINDHDEKLHAMIRITPNDLLEEAAKSLDQERAAGKTRGPLHGIPIIIKVCCGQ